METIDISQTQEIFTVSRLNREARFILESSFPLLWVEGEISNFSAPNSGHWYFSLKDHQAQVRCAMFKPTNRRLSFTPKDGMHVMLKARISLYEGRGDFQLIIEHIEEIGEGKLRQAFEALKKRLMAAGLFDSIHKKSFPAHPKTLGIVTSPTGAAIRDILSVLARRFPALPIIIYPTLVQGETAAPNIARAIRLANEHKTCDVLIVARGGGSLEDLWPFNEEIVANAIFESAIPIISGVGHEVDFTIADFVADLRAPTPSAAAELISPNCDELHATINQIEQRFIRQLKQKLDTLKQNLAWMNVHLQQQHPKRRLIEQSQRLDMCELTLRRLQIKILSEYKAKLAHTSLRLSNSAPLQLIKQYEGKLSLQLQHLAHSVKHQLQQNQQKMATLAASLDSLSPLATLKRGYAIATLENKVLRDSAETRTGDKIKVQLAKGILDCTVT